MHVLSASQARQLVDCEQVYAAYRAARREYSQRFAGAMAWKGVRGRQYLYRKKEQVWRSLGPRLPETERTYEQFCKGREKLKARRKSLDDEIRRMAPVNRAMRLGRVPWIAARLLRKLERAGLLGHGLRVAGTHALFAYERMGGVHFRSEALATNDIDPLRDSRAGLSFVGADLREPGLLGVLRSIDPTFHPTEVGSFRAVNDKGFMVDLITPMLRNPAVRASPAESEGDLRPVEIAGLAWLENSPTVEQIVIDDKGFPLTIVAPDPRAFALHKLWLSRRNDRDPVKRRRDAAQAGLVAAMLAAVLPHYRFDDPVLDAFPAEVRSLSAELMSARGGPEDSASWDDE
ncbi:MAG: GSU2403 family nucleotidyltransferase fold protein [Allosphingosinicella sp.]